MTDPLVPKDAQTSGSALSTSGTLTDTPTTADLARRERIRRPSVADEFRESLTSEPVVFHDLESSGPSRRRGRGVAVLQRPVEAGKYQPTSELVPGPVGHQPEGSMSGRIIYCSGGHGWTCDNSATAQWYTQRPITFGVVEDFGNLDQFNLFADYCFRAGATVVPMRPIGHQAIERVVDNNDPNHVRFQGPWNDSVSTIAYGMAGDRVPYRFAIAEKNETAVARFAPYIPKADIYPVYCWSRDGADRINQTYRIVHGGGVTEVNVNHRRVGKGWVYLGEYFFDEGSDGYVEVTNQAIDPADADGRHVVIADAIRFGNGMGDVNRSSGISGNPREEEASRYWVERALYPGADPIFNGTPDETDQNNNVGSPPRMAALMNRESEGSNFDRLFISFHSNAAGGRGVVGLFGTNPDLRPNKQVEWAELVAREINAEMTGRVSDLPTTWVVRNKLTDSHINFGEIRGDYINMEMASTIAEVAFHDNPLDASLLRLPRVRLAMAKASFRAALKYFKEFAPDHRDFTMLPESPEILSVSAESPNHALVQWASGVVKPGDAPAASYRVYQSTDGFGFDGGTVTTGGTSMLVENLTTGTAHYFRVTAVNAGGESKPSRVLGMAYIGKQPETLVVSGFSSLTEDLDLVEFAAIGLGSAMHVGGDFVRIIPRLMNPGDQVAVAGNAILESGRGFESCSAEVLSVLPLSPARHKTIALLFGRQSLENGLFSDKTRAALENYLKAGGNLFVSGTHVTADLDDSTTRPSDAARKFAADVLQARFGGETTLPQELRGEAGGILAGQSFDVSTAADPRFAPAALEMLKPVGASKALLQFSYDPNAVAGTGVLNPSTTGSVVVFGFPFEAIGSSDSRVGVISPLLSAFGVGAEKLDVVRPTGSTTSTATARGPRPGAARRRR